MNRKGITPVIATSLLILIAISAVTGAAIFLRDTTGDLTDSVNDQLSDDQRREGSEISINYGYNNSNGNISVIVKNSGEYTLAVEESNQKKWSLYNDGRPQDFNYSDYSNPSNVFLDPGETVTIETGIRYPVSGPKTMSIQGPFGVSATLICTSEGGSQSC